ncbi:Toll-like receptor e [Elysia marginata]|uniref:Toll-like receptor e n=1 Tax=Elysia marginata TaxID=1093978 RepID=A0AAV4EES7_9GAST|nr:Toll-like receptor e [Elysia marginata]
MVSALVLCPTRASIFVLAFEYFLWFHISWPAAFGLENMDIPISFANDGEGDANYEKDMSDMDISAVSERFPNRPGSTSYTGSHTLEECSVCDEKLPAPDPHFTVAGYQGNKGSSEISMRFPNDDTDCCRINDIQANCTSCNLTAVPTTLPPFITRLLLGHNALTTESLFEGPFKIYPRLRVLSLSTNQITYLPHGAFDGLPSLVCLCLQFNDIKMDQSLNSSWVFQPLNNSLVYLRLNGFNRNTTNVNLMYPSYALSFLSKLKYLFIDGIPLSRFENPQRQITSLTHLVMAGFRYGYCNLTGLQSEAFEFDTLSHLDIGECQLDGRYVNRSAFENLYRLQSLTISNNFQLGIQTVGELMYSFRNSRFLKDLIMDRINPRFSPCIVIYKNTLRHLQNTRLEKILAMDNEIEIIEKGALQMLPKTLKVLNMTANKIIFGDYIQDLGYLTGLTDLILDGSEKPYNFPRLYPNDLFSNCMGIFPNLAKSPEMNDSPSTVQQNSEITTIPLPPKLFKVYMSGNGMAYTLHNITFSTTNNLISADLSRNVFEDLYGPIRGLENLAVLKMDYCYIQYISYEFFDFFPSLGILSLYQNQLGKSLAVDENGDIFENLRNLTLLNLAENDIWHLYPPAFKNMAKLKHIDLSENRLGAVQFSLAHMKSLQTLNLKSNQIQTLTPETMAAVDEISKGRKPLWINLSFNPIRCDCDNLKFLEWLTNSGHMNRLRDDYYLCDMVKQPKGYKEVIERLRRECIKHQLLFVVVISATMIAMLAVLIVTAYRFR